MPILLLKMLNYLQKEFHQHFRTPATVVVKAPGRFNVIGEHTDYNQGYAFPAALHQGIYFAFSIRDGFGIDAVALDRNERLSLSIGSTASSLPGWGRYLAAATAEWRDRSLPLPSFRVAFTSDLPVGAGLSSSAALCCGVLYGLRILTGASVPDTELAKMAQAAEHRLGLQCGLLDQYAILFGLRNQGFLLDFQTMERSYYRLDLPGCAWLLIESGKTHQLAKHSGYNERRASCERVAQVLGCISLRDVTLTQLEGARNRLDPFDWQCARFILSENNRVLQARNALDAGEPYQLGQLLLASHQGLQQQYQVSTPELDTLVELAKGYPHVYGARMMGGGFGGSVLLLVKSEKTALVTTQLLDGYRQATGIVSRAYSIQPGPGVQQIA